ncbi:hypothetical protein [Reinekea sp.]|jgi:hypothetical protein|uniref:hypothetical protein n=1 Tax=Reinekea sp. TaxID=1970455 RepID=UPI002A7FABB3|nr:hypothetical protein [Reinekea sp.]
MATKHLSPAGVIDQYLDALLLEVPSPAFGNAAELSLAQVQPGFEMICLWHNPVNDAQTLCMELILLSHLQKLSESRLKDLLWLKVRSHHHRRQQYG